MFGVLFFHGLFRIALVEAISKLGGFLKI